MTTVESGPPTKLVPLADYLGNVLRRLRPLPPVDVDLDQAYLGVLAKDAIAPGSLPAFDHAEHDGYAVRSADVAIADPQRPARLNVIGDVSVSSWRPVRITPGACFSIAAGAPLPEGADAVVPLADTDQGIASVAVYQPARRGQGVRREGEQLAAGAVVACAGSRVTPAVVAVLAGTGVGHVTVRPSPRVAVIATGGELVDVGRPSQPGQVVDVNSHALCTAVLEAGAQAYRIGICDDDPDGLRGLLQDQALRADLIITTGGTGAGPGDMVRRALSRPDGGDADAVEFCEMSLYPRATLGFGTIGSARVPVVCLPGDPAAALIGFEVLARPVIRRLSGADQVFRQSVKAHLLQTVSSPAGLREFRPAYVAERRGGGYTVQPLAGGPYTLTGLAEANGLLIFGERVTSVPAGSTVDVLLLDWCE